MNTLLQFAQSTYDYTYTTTQTTSDVSPAAIVGFILVYFAIIAVVYILNALLLGRIFKKAGVPAWVAWVPFYNNWKMLEIGGQQGFWAVLAIIPLVSIVSLVFMLIAIYNIGLKLGKSGAFLVLYIFLPLVWLIWLAVDSSTWNDSLGAPSKAPEHLGNASTPPAAPTATV